MIILAIDSTAIIATCAVCRDNELLSQFSVNNGNTHSETLLPMIESSLKLLNMTISDIDMFACSEGPGSFTGVRIGAATIKGLAFGKNKSCIGVSTLEALAYNFFGFRGIVCPVMNARRGQVYNALFRCDGGKPIRLCADRVISAAELASELSEYSKENIYICGDGDFIMNDFTEFTSSPFPEILRRQSGCSVALCALDKYNEGANGTDIELAPTYLRPSQAERERSEKEKV